MTVSSECPKQVVLGGEPIDCIFPRGHVPPCSWALPCRIVDGRAIPDYYEPAGGEAQ